MRRPAPFMLKDGSDAFMSEIIVESFDAALNPDLWQPLCEKMIDHFGASAFLMLEYDMEASTIPSLYAASKTLSSPDGFARLLAAVNAAMTQDEGHEERREYQLFAQTTPCELIPEYALYGVEHDRQMPPNPIRDTVLSGTGSMSRNVARLNDIGPWIDMAALYMPDYSANVPPETWAKMNFLIPILGKSLETSRVVRNLTRSFGAIFDVFNSLDFGVAIVSGDGKTLMSNSTLTEITNERDGLAKIGGRLAAQDSGHQDAFSTLLQLALTPGTPPKDLIMPVPRRSGIIPYIVKTAPVRLPDSRATAKPLALVLVIDPEDEARFSSQGIAAFGTLTPAELEVCDLLIRGVETKEISSQRGTSVETTRGQIKSLSGKMQCRSRLDLVRLAMASNVPVKPSGGPQANAKPHSG